MMKGKPIWIKGKEREMNVHAVFRAKTELKPKAELHVAGAAFYRVFVNGTFLGFGPARTAKGYAREDIFSLEDFSSECEVVIEAVGYCCRSFSTVFQPSFLMAEIQCGGQVPVYTGRDFEGFLPGCKVQRTERYSMQRHFSEVWDYRECVSCTDEKFRASVAVLSEAPQILERKAPYPLYKDIVLSETQYMGNLEYDASLPYRDQYSWTEEPAYWGCFAQEQIAHHPYVWIQRHRQTVTEQEKPLPVVLNQGEYAIFDFDRVEAGFLTASIEALEESDIVIGFCEYYNGPVFTFGKMNAKNALEYLFAGGQRKAVMSFEPYTFRFVIVAVKKGKVRLNSFGMKTYMFDISAVSCPESGDKVLDAVSCAAVRTFAHNAVDLYMDCPSRERAGWLCDSYFTAKTEYALTGDSRVEDAFLENYRLYKNEGEYPKGVIPKCYPSDKATPNPFVPQWTMWYILEVEEYVHDRNHADMAEEFRESIYGLLDFYKQYENEDGLLERLPAWNFVEWSEANSWTWDVSYPTNFLYAQVLECVWKLYGDRVCRNRSEEVRRTAVRQSFQGKYFLDHAVRDEQGKLCVQKHSSEACQYYAVLFGGIDIRAPRYKELEQLILHVFTPGRESEMPEIIKVNAFIGVYLRLETLRRMGEYRLLLKDVKEFFGGMGNYTETLWEYRQFNGSYDHGFASYAYVVIQEALTKIKMNEKFPPTKNVTVQPTPFAKAPTVLSHCSAANFAHNRAFRSCRT